MSDSEYQFDGEGDLRERLLRSEHLRALEAFEAQLRSQKLVPDSRKLLARRFEILLQIMCAGAIGLFVAMFTLADELHRLHQDPALLIRDAVDLRAR